jgi:hypothetical protein
MSLRCLVVCIELFYLYCNLKIGPVRGPPYQNSSFSTLKLWLNSVIFCGICEVRFQIPAVSIYFLLSRSGRVAKLTNHFYLMSRLRMVLYFLFLCLHGVERAILLFWLIKKVFDRRKKLVCCYWFYFHGFVHSCKDHCVCACVCNFMYAVSFPSKFWTYLWISHFRTSC